MGLSIIAYSNLRNRECRDDEIDSDGCYCYVNPSFRGREEPFKEGYYEGDDDFGFHAGSYSGYNAWRARLCELVHGVPPKTVWSDHESWAGKPFVELIDFSDCEGTLGTTVSIKLLKDFKEYRAIVANKLDNSFEDSYFMQKYDNWLQAFSLAANNGAVCFH